MKKILTIVFVILLNMVFLYVPTNAQAEKLETSLALDILIKSEVETAVSMLQAIYTKHEKGEMSLVQAKKLGGDLLRELRYGTEGYFWAHTTEGVLVIHHRKDIEGKNRFEVKDKQGKFYTKELLAKGKAGGGFVEYWTPKKGKTAPQQPKRSYVLLFKPFGWVIGSGYYR